MKLTHLDMVQNILSALGSDEVNSYADTAESRQVSEIIRTSYMNIISRAQLPEHKTLFSLTPSNDIDQPTLMYRPENVAKIEWIKYDVSDLGVITEPEYRYVTVLPIEQFLDMNHQVDPTASNTGSFILNDYTFYYKNDIQPCYCTIINDYYIIFDSYNADVDATLQETKTMCYGLTIPSYTLADTFIPNLDDRQFSLLLNEAKSLAFLELKQTAHEKAEREVRRQWNSLQHNKRTADVPSDFDQLSDFGRKRNTRSNRWIRM